MGREWKVNMSSLKKDSRGKIECSKMCLLIKRIRVCKGVLIIKRDLKIKIIKSK